MTKKKHKKSVAILAEQHKDCTAILKALVGSARYAVVYLLMEKPREVSELKKILDIENTLLSHHLRKLKSKGVVQSVRKGRAVLYSIAKGIKRGNSITLNKTRVTFL